MLDYRKRMKTDILKIKGDWQEVADDCRSTVGKPPLWKEPSKDFKVKLLIAEHSPIRDISVRWIWRGIKSWVATHWTRHKWEPFVTTQRTDRTGVNRDDLPQDAPVVHIMDINAQALMTMARRRLCGQADPATCGVMRKIVAAVSEVCRSLARFLCRCANIKKAARNL